MSRPTFFKEEQFALINNVECKFVDLQDFVEVLIWDVSFYLNSVFWNVTLALHFGCTQFNALGPCQTMHFFDQKCHTTQWAWPLGAKGFGPILAFWPITSEEFKPLTQQVGPSSRCKTTFTYGATSPECHCGVPFCAHGIACNPHGEVRDKTSMLDHNGIFIDKHPMKHKNCVITWLLTKAIVAKAHANIIGRNIFPNIIHYKS